ncbi:MAG: hypothetical protein KJ025_07565 [Burkholderiales bacterium]|nr:hypothetical protein [Burkholderiales bacterium]
MHSTSDQDADAALAGRLGAIDDALRALETEVGARADIDVAEVLEPAIVQAGETMRAYLAAAGGKAAPAPDADVLDVWKALVKGDPGWNAIRDSCRELVYYRNCLAAARRDAFPPAPQKMAVRLARHVYLYVRARCIREGRVAD